MADDSVWLRLKVSRGSNPHLAGLLRHPMAEPTLVCALGLWAECDGLDAAGPESRLPRYPPMHLGRVC